jgi:hypothetical protein
MKLPAGKSFLKRRNLSDYQEDNRICRLGISEKYTAISGRMEIYGAHKEQAPAQNEVDGRADV